MSILTLVFVILGALITLHFLQQPTEPSYQLAINFLAHHPDLQAAWKTDFSEATPKILENNTSLQTYNVNGRWQGQSGKINLVTRQNPGQTWIVTEATWIPHQGPSKKMATPHEWLAAAQMAATKNDFLSAEQNCNFIAQTNPDDFRAQYCDAIVSLLHKQNFQAEQFVKRMAKKFPDSAVVQILAADILKRVSTLEATLAAYQRAFTLIPSADTASQAIRVALDNKNYTSASKWLTAAQEHRLNSVDLSYVKARYLLETNQPSQAMAAFTETLQKDQKHAQAWYGLALCYQLSHLIDQAQSALTKSIQVMPANNLAARKALSRLLIEQEKFPQAVVELKETLARHPKDAQSTAWLTVLLAHNGDLTESQALYAKLKNLTPEHAQELIQELDLPASRVANNVKSTRILYSF